MKKYKVMSQTIWSDGEMLSCVSRSNLSLSAAVKKTFELNADTGGKVYPHNCAESGVKVDFLNIYFVAEEKK